MAETKTSQSQQNVFENPFVGAWLEQLASLESKSAEQAKVAIDESAKLMKQTLEYSLKMSAEWRKLALENSRRAGEWMTPKA
jgi:hypothetical protein